ncbi:uncharacterized protein LOC113233283, partial [Hyposmocoma kahamanoa]|uniref:uncharacterized protein LOC113233283 n=1 Tax=Hyposmocoma kahamanoa TaxID=1477025 RepID=UPI000E6DA410
MIIALQTLVFFRESLLSVVDRLLGPYFNRFTLTFARHISEDEEEEEEEVYAEFDDEKGVIFYPPVYAQRYAAVTDCLMDERWCGKLEKVIDLGYHDMSFIKYLKDVPGVHTILGVDIETIPLRCSSDLLGCEEYAPIRENPLQVTLFEGNAADPDYRLIGCDAVIAIEMIEHMLPHDLDRLVHNVFGFVKPWVAVITTPNGDFNVLFKKLEKNGLRRLDHFFEWSREQFHDWCSNIVVRYPQFTVSCKGVGPGPVGTHHIGCCSQLALFVNKDYHKQPDLNLNSLALVTDIPTRDNIADMYAGWDTPIPKTVDMIPHDKMESLSDFLSSDKKSCVTIVIASAITMDRLVYCDKMSQCNLDSEVGKNFLMFNDEDMCCSMLAPRRKLEFKVYEIEDVNSRLNCTTFSVTKFSKQTQNMMAKHKIDSLVHTREVVSEIQHLTKMLNFHDMSTSDDSTSIWCNINWGENAPYWNQYYKIIRNYNYPFEAKSEECRILDLISEEINRLIDMEYRDNAAKYADKFEIPIEILMNAVKHITDDTMRVKDLLEWNGYEIQGNMVLYSRLVVDHTSVTTGEEEWPEFDTESDYETTDGRSTTFSDGSTVTPDFHGRGLRRALDKKVRGLRALLSADEDISTELDRVVCRLMKLALFTCKGKQTPPPTKWMQCKLLDLLTLTEKAIARRKRHCLEKFAFKAIGFGDSTCQEGNESSLAIDKMKEDNANVKKIVAKYIHILESDNIDDYNTFKYRYDDDVLTRDIASNATIKDFEFSDMNFSQTLDHNFESTERMSEDDSSKNRAWIEKDNLEVVPYHEHNLRTFISPLDYTYNSEIRQFKKINKIPNTSLRIQEDKKPYRRSHSAETKHEN